MFDVTTSGGLLVLAGVAGMILSVVVALLVLYVQRATSSPPKLVGLVTIVLLLVGTPFGLGPLVQWLNPTSGVEQVFVHPSQLVLLGPSMLAAVVALTVWMKNRVHEPV